MTSFINSSTTVKSTTVDAYSEENYFADFRPTSTASLSSSKNKSNNLILTYNDLVNDDDFYYDKKSSLNNLYPLLIIALTFICILTIIVCLIYSLFNRKSRTHPTYRLLNHYLFFNIFLSLNVCLKILSSTMIRDSHYYTRKTNLICTVHQFIYLFIDSSQSFQLLLIWLILLSERNLINCKFLYVDYELENLLKEEQQQQQRGATVNFDDLEAANGTGSVESSPSNNVNRQQLLELRKNTLGNRLIRNSRTLLLTLFYVLMFFLAVFFSPTMSYEMRGIRICIQLAHNNFFYLFQILFMFLYYFPIIYYFLIATTFFAKYFGGEADPIRGNLSESDVNRVKLIKHVTLLKCLIEFFMEIHSSSYFYLSPFLYEVLRVLGFVSILVTTILFFKYENFYAKLRENVLNQRPVNLIFRQQRQNEQNDVVDYSNLVENDD